MQEKSKTRKGTLKDKDTKILEFFGHKAYSLTSLQLHMVNCQALFEKYNFLTWVEVTPFLFKFPQEYREKLKEIIKEGQKFIRTALQVAMNASSATARSVVMAITIIWT